MKRQYSITFTRTLPQIEMYILMRLLQKIANSCTDGGGVCGKVLNLLLFLSFSCIEGWGGK